MHAFVFGEHILWTRQHENVCIFQNCLIDFFGVPDLEKKNTY